MNDIGKTAPHADAMLRHILAEAVFRRKSLFLSTFVAVACLTILLIRIIPRSYQADAKIMVQSLRTQPNLSTGSPSRIVSSEDITGQQMTSEVELFRSQAVARRALHLPDIAAVESPEQTSQEEKQVRSLQSRLTVEPIRQSSIINLSLTADSPAAAAGQLSRILDAYFEQRTTLASVPGAADFFASQSQQFGNKLDQARSELTRFESQHGFVDLDNQKKLQTQRIAALDDNISSTRTHLADQNSRSRTLLGTLARTERRHAEQNTDSNRRLLGNWPAQQSADTENKATPLLDHATAADDRALHELDQKIVVTQQAIKEATEHPDTDGNEHNPLWLQVQSLLIQANAEISGTLAQQTELIQQRDAARRRLHELLDATGSYDRLNRQFQEVQSDYNIYVQKRDEALVNEALEHQKMFDVSIVQRPVANPTPIRPRPVLWLAIGLLLALVLSTTAALIADSASSLIATPHQLYRATRAHVLATISEFALADRPTALTDLPPASLLEYRRLLYTLRATILQKRKPDNISPLEAASKELAADTPLTYSIAFTSTLPGEGVSYITRNLAIETVRQTSARVALIDMKTLMHIVQTGGPITAWLALDPASGCWELYFGPNLADQPDGILLGRLHSPRAWALFTEQIQKVRREFSWLFFDCPSLSQSTVAAELDTVVDGYVILVSAGMVRKHQAIEPSKLLRQTRSPLLGCLLNRRSNPVPRWLNRLLW